MGTIVNLFVKFSGLGWLWQAADGAKTYITATVAVLTGLLGLIQEIQPLLASHDAGGLFNLLKGLPHDQSWLTFIGGFGVIFLRHSIAKSTAQPAAAAAPQP